MTVDHRLPANAQTGARPGVTDQADIACTKHKAPYGARRVASREG